jgi:hypothetical protein
MSRHTLTLALEVDDELLEAERELAAKAGTLEDFYGEPFEWRSILDVENAIEAGVIVRSEILDLRDGEEPWRPEPLERPRRWWEFWR